VAPFDLVPGPWQALGDRWVGLVIAVPDSDRQGVTCDPAAVALTIAASKRKP